MTTRRSLLLRLGALALGAAGAWWLREEVLWPTPKPRFVGRATSGWLPFASDEPVPIVQALVNGVEALALIDSGAEATTLDLAFADRLGLPLTAIAPVIAFGVNGEPRIGRSAAVDVAAGALRLPRLRAAVLDLGPIARASSDRVSLILGQDVLHQLIADIDFLQGQIALRGPDAEPPGGATPVPTQAKGRELVTPVVIERTAVDAVIDTGASAALAVSARIAAAAGLLAGRTSVPIPSITFGGLSRDRLITARSLEFGGKAYEDVPVQVYPDPGGGARIPDALLGSGLLQGRRAWLDMGRGRFSLLASGPASG